MGDFARCHEAIAWPEHKDLVSYGDLQFSEQDKIRFILARMRMPRHAHSRRETDLQEAVCTSGVVARQTNGADTHVEVMAVRSRLMFDCRSSMILCWNVMHGRLLFCGEVPPKSGRLPAAKHDPCCRAH